MAGETWTGMLAQAYGPFWLPCHLRMDPDRGAKNQDHTQVAPCAGAAIFRTHIHRPEYLNKPLTPHLPANPELVFTGPVDFLAHHMKVSPADALVEFLRVPLMVRIQEQINRAESRTLAKI